MSFTTLWSVLAIIAVIALIVSFFMGKNAIWGTLTFGFIIAIIVGFIFKDNGYNWLLFKKVLIVSILLGVFFEILGRVSSSKRGRI